MKKRPTVASLHRKIRSVLYLCECVTCERARRKELRMSAPKKRTHPTKETT